MCQCIKRVPRVSKELMHGTFDCCGENVSMQYTCRKKGTLTEDSLKE